VLIDQQQNRVAVAIKAKLAQPLHLAGGFALSPQSFARPRPVTDAPFGQGRSHRLVVHPRHHQNFAGVVLLRDGWHESVAVESDRADRLVNGIPR
jgi:hypothetical protein